MIHQGLMTPYSFIDRDNGWFGWWFGSCSTPNYYLKLCWIVVKCTIRNFHSTKWIWKISPFLFSSQFDKTRVTCLIKMFMSRGITPFLGIHMRPLTVEGKRMKYILRLNSGLHRNGYHIYCRIPYGDDGEINHMLPRIVLPKHPMTQSLKTYLVQVRQGFMHIMPVRQTTYLWLSVRVQ